MHTIWYFLSCTVCWVSARFKPVTPVAAPSSGILLWHNPPLHPCLDCSFQLSHVTGTGPTLTSSLNVSTQMCRRWCLREKWVSTAHLEVAFEDAVVLCARCLYRRLQRGHVTLQVRHTPCLPLVAAKYLRGWSTTGVLDHPLPDSRSHDSGPEQWAGDKIFPSPLIGTLA